MATVLLDLGAGFLLILAPLLLFLWYWNNRELTTREWALLCFVILAGGVLARIAVVALLAALILVGIGVAWLWNRVILTDVDYSRSFAQTHLFPGESTTVTWTFRNDKPLPVSWLRWQEGVPIHPFGALRHGEGLQIEDIDIRIILDGGADGIDEVTSIGGFQTLIKTARISALRRGYYRFGPTQWDASDVLGLYRTTKRFEADSALTVYPRLFSPEQLQLPTEAILGDLRRRSFVEDPSWYRGARDYRSSDPMKTIDWLATARTRRMQVKVFEPTVHPKLMILANLHAFERISRGVITEYMEDVISAAGSIARWGLETGFEVGLHSNGALPGSHMPLRIPPSARPEQLFLILDYLARIMLIVDRNVEDLIRRDVQDLPHGSSLVICTNVITQGMTSVLTDIGRHRRVTVLLIDNDTRFSIPNVTVTQLQTGRRAA